MTTREAEIASDARRYGISYEEAERNWDAREAACRCLARLMAAYDLENQPA